MMNGDVDVIDRVDPKTVALLGRAPNLDILELTGTLHIRSQCVWTCTV